MNLLAQPAHIQAQVVLAPPEPAGIQAPMHSQQTRDPITVFREEHFFLSNMFRCRHGVEFEEDIYGSSEAAFQAAKAPGAERRILQRMDLDPFEAKRWGRRLPLRPDWDEVKVTVMMQCVKSKCWRGGRMDGWVEGWVFFESITSRCYRVKSAEVYPNTQLLCVGVYFCEWSPRESRPRLAGGRPVGGWVEGWKGGGWKGEWKGGG